jgi:hypothetical protein
LEHFVTIELFGQPYTFKSDAEASKAKEVADLLLQEVAKIQEQQLDEGLDLSQPLRFPV